MSKSNTMEIIAILWLIAGLLAPRGWRILFFALAIENTIESMVWAYKDKKSQELERGKHE